MLYFIIGASGSGKTACIPFLKSLLPEKMSIKDFDEIGVPENPDTAWRQKATETWIQRYLDEYQEKDLCLCGQMVPGEILASPSAEKLESIHICFLDCHEVTRIKRLKSRNTYEVNQDTLSWAAWLRAHLFLPQWEQRVIKTGSWDKMCFDRWDNLETWGDLIKSIVIDTTHLSRDTVAENLVTWISKNPNMSYKQNIQL